MLRVPETVPARPLAVLRIGVGLVAVAKGFQFVYKILFGGKPEPTYAYIPALPDTVWTVLACVMIVSGALVVAGYRTRLALLVTGLDALAFVWGAYYHNHVYLLATLALMLTFTNSDAALSISSAQGRGREEVWGPPVYLLRAQISIVYIYAALNKVNFDFLSGNALSSLGFRSALVPDWFRTVPLLVTMAACAVILELYVGVALWVRRLRTSAMVCGLLLHVGMVTYMSRGLVMALNLAVFAVMMISGYALFLDRLPDFRPIWRRWKRTDAASPPSAARQTSDARS